MWLCKRDLSKECEGKYRDCTDCVLDKIKEEIKSKKFGLTDTEDGRRIQSDIHAAFDGGIECALQIIDKYKIEGKKGARNE